RRLVLDRRARGPCVRVREGRPRRGPRLRPRPHPARRDDARNGRTPDPRRAARDPGDPHDAPRLHDGPGATARGRPVQGAGMVGRDREAVRAGAPRGPAPGALGSPRRAGSRMKSRLNRDHRARLEALRRAYGEELPRRVQAIERAAAALSNPALRPEALEAAYHLVHRFSGSSAIYGFAEVRRTGASLETRLRSRM